MMEDGYWEALLRDMDGEASVPRPVGKEEVSLPDEMYVAGLWRPRSEFRSPDDEESDWQRAQELLASEEAVTLTITGYNRGGLLADFGLIQGFVPASHLLAPPVAQAPGPRMAALAARIGEKMTLRAIEIDRERRRLILSERCAQTDTPAAALFASLRPGQVCEGVVTNLCAFGAFVDLGGYEGLVHISELSWGRVSTPGEILQSGEQVQVVVLEVNPQAQKVALSLKRLRPDPWQGVDKRYYVGQVLEATITNVVSFGAFARLEEGLEGLVHISELAEGSFMHPRNIVNEGDKVRVQVLHVDAANHRLALTMRGAEGGSRGRHEATPEVEIPA